jgi:hypothetical protein
MMLAAGAAAVAGGFLFAYWPLALAGVAVAALGGSGASALGLGLLCDLAYGAPPGWLQYAVFPFTLAALAAFVAGKVLSRLIMNRSLQDAL